MSTHKKSSGFGIGKCHSTCPLLEDYKLNSYLANNK